jgi:hypothetical protein
LRSDTIRPIGEHVEICMTAKKSLEEKIVKIKGLLAHSHPELSTGGSF